jgi:acetyl esterase/lipase
MKTHTYKTAGDVKIQADVHRADDERVRPVVVWFHGGALIVGSRSSVPRNLLELCKGEGYALVSFDYRLAPEVKLPDILDDVKDAFAWLRESCAQEPRLHLDTDRVVVTGGSAGGYLTLLSGVHVRPRPRGLVAYWGYGDVDGDWYTKPSEFYRKQPLVSREEAAKAVGGKVLAGTEPNTPEQKARGRHYLYLRQNGLWTKEVTGFDPEKDRRKLDPYCPVRNVTPDYPPTLLLHGTKDDDVPYEQSAAMAKELAKHKVAHELVTVMDAGHGLAGGDRKLNDAAHEKALAFIRKQLKGRNRTGKGSRQPKHESSSSSRAVPAPRSGSRSGRASGASPCSAAAVGGGSQRDLAAHLQRRGPGAEPPRRSREAKRLDQVVVHQGVDRVAASGCVSHGAQLTNISAGAPTRWLVSAGRTCCRSYSTLKRSKASQSSGTPRMFISRPTSRQKWNMARRSCSHISRQP